MLRPWSTRLTISEDKRKPLYIRITDSIIEAIKSGTLKPGEVLPGSRQMAAMLKVNRNTITKAYDILLVEGWLNSSERKSTYVSEQLFTETQTIKNKVTKTIDKNGSGKKTLFFDHGLPDTSIAPMDELARAYRRIFSRKAKWQLLATGNELGDQQFREAISKMLNHHKGMATSANELCITRGTQMSLFLTAHTLLAPGDIVLIENPGYRPAWNVFEHVGAKLIPIDMDCEGINVEQVEFILTHTPVKALYLTPHHQFPTTVTLSLSRRLKLIALSNRYGFTIIEDDYDSEFYYGQRPKRPVCSHYELNHFIYLGTFSKLIAPAIRIGYLYSSHSFIERIGALRRIIDFQGDRIMEESILELIHTGAIRRHQKKALSYYQRKRDFLCELLDKYLQDKVSYRIPDGGLALWLTFNEKIDLFKLHAIAHEKGLVFHTPDRFSFDEMIPGIRIGYASLTENQMEKGIQILRGCSRDSSIFAPNQLQVKSVYRTWSMFKEKPGKV